VIEAKTQKSWKTRKGCENFSNYFTIPAATRVKISQNSQELPLCNFQIEATANFQVL
jgi:hypothetical protein